jgi:hypothetical protein
MTDDERQAALAAAYARPLEDPVAKWKREADAIDAARAEARAELRAQERRDAADAAAFWHAVDARIAAASAEHERGILDIIREGLAGTADLGEVVGRRLDKMQTTLDKLSGKLSDLCSHEDRRPLDLSNPLQRRVN